MDERDRLRQRIDELEAREKVRNTVNLPFKSLSSFRTNHCQQGPKTNHCQLLPYTPLAGPPAQITATLPC